MIQEHKMLFTMQTGAPFVVMIAFPEITTTITRTTRSQVSGCPVLNLHAGMRLSNVCVSSTSQYNLKFPKDTVQTAQACKLTCLIIPEINKYSLHVNRQESCINIA